MATRYSGFQASRRGPGFRFTCDVTFPYQGAEFTVHNRMDAGAWRAFLLGDRAAKLPREGMATRELDGVSVWVDPMGERSRRRPHRIFYRCSCGRAVPVGRSHQHKCGA